MARTTPGAERGSTASGAPDGSLLWWALRVAAEQRCLVFPVRGGGKTPRFRGWQGQASDDPAQLRRWFGRGRHNIGIDTGRSGLLVVDLDDGHGDAPPPRWRGARSGRDVFAALVAEADVSTPVTYTVATPSGQGLHLYFRQPPGTPLPNTQGRLGWCIDTRGAGGFVVAAGSRRVDGTRYRVVHEAPIAPLPPWLAERLTPPPPQPPHRPLLLPSTDAVQRHVRAVVDTACTAAAQAPCGRRHAALLRAARICGQLVGGGALDERAARESLYAATAHHVGVQGCTRREIDRTITDGLDYGRRAPRRINLRPQQ